MKTLYTTIALSTLLLAGCATEDPTRELSVEEKKADTLYTQGTNDLVAKRYQQALISLLKAKELDPNNTKVRTNLGMAYYFREQPVLAITELKDAINLDKKNSDAKMNLATIYMEQNKIKEAKNLYNEVVADLTYSALFRVHYNLALLNLKIGDRKSAFDELKAAIKEKDDYCQAHYKLGELYTEEYKYREAYLSYVEGTKGTCVSLPEPHFAVAEALINLNRIDDARKKLEMIIEKFPKTEFRTLATKRIRSLKQEEKENTATQSIQTNENNNQLTETPKF